MCDLMFIFPKSAPSLPFLHNKSSRSSHQIFRKSAPCSNYGPEKQALGVYYNKYIPIK